MQTYFSLLQLGEHGLVGQICTLQLKTPVGKHSHHQYGMKKNVTN